MLNIINWLFSIHPARNNKNEIEKLLLSMRTTAKCRYHASIRLQWQGKFAFFTTVVLSLGIIFIPLMQTTGILLAFKPSVLNMIQIFLAVAILVYSVVIANARFDLRAEKLNECGDRLKELIREFGSDKEASLIDKDRLKFYQTRYTDIIEDAENHGRSDYTLAVLEMDYDYKITGVLRVLKYIIAYGRILIPYVLPMLMLYVEIVLITDMLGATHIFSNSLNGDNVRQLHLINLDSNLS